jgi:hypothetical protein
MDNLRLSHNQRYNNRDLYNKVLDPVPRNHPG